MTGGSITIGEEATAKFGMDVKVAGGSITNNGGYFKANSLTLSNGGKFTSALNGETFGAAQINLQDGGILNLTELNSKLEGGALLVSGVKDHPLTVNLSGGEIRLNDHAYTGQFKIGEKEDAGTVNITGGEYHASKIWFGSAAGNTLNVTGGDLHVTTFDATYGTTTIGSVKGTSYGDLIAGTVVLGEAASAEAPATQPEGQFNETFTVADGGYAEIGNLEVNKGYKATVANGG